MKNYTLILVALLVCLLVLGGFALYSECYDLVQQNQSYATQINKLATTIVDKNIEIRSLEEQVETLTTDNVQLKKRINELEKANQKLEVTKTSKTRTFRVTAYCPCTSCCGKWAGGKTASGTTPTAGRTIAVDPTIIPYGTEVVLNGHTYIAEDCGGAIKGNEIDVFFNTHSEAMNFGVKYWEGEIKL